MGNLIYEKVNEVGVITMNRPEVLNALNIATLKELDLLLDQIMADTSVKAIVITGSGKKAFVAGADIMEMKDMSALEARNFAGMGQDVFTKLENLPVPVIAAINGFALGGGCELAMACDIRLASKDAKFGQPEVRLGVIPGFDGTQRLPRLVGKGKAKELLFTGEQISADEAFRIGLVNAVCDKEELMSLALDMAQKITSQAPVAVRLCKSAVNEGMDTDLDTATALEREMFALCFSTLDQTEGMQAFVEKRKAAFRGC